MGSQVRGGIRGRPARGGVVNARVTAVMNALRRLFRAARAAAQTAERTVGISGAQHFVLEELARAPALSLNDLAARSHTHKSSVSVVVSRLVARRLVRRRTSVADRRSITLSITPAGRAALRRAPASAQKRFLASLRRLPAGDLAALAAGLERFTEYLGIRTLTPTMLFEEEGEGAARRR